MACNWIVVTVTLKSAEANTITVSTSGQPTSKSKRIQRQTVLGMGMIGMKRNLIQTFEIRDNANDPKVKLQAVAIANDCYKSILDMSTNAGIVSDAFKYVTKKTLQLNTLQKLVVRILFKLYSTIIY